MPERQRNILLTGIPRSGTTLVAAMIDSIPDTVALNEPRWQYNWMMRSKNAATIEDFSKWIIGDFAIIRHKLQHGIPIPERRLGDGTAVTNYYRWHSEQQETKEVFKLIPFTRPGLSDHFTLAIKHNGLYLAALQQLAESGQFTVIAIIRHPIGVIGSWQDVPIPLGEGKMPGAMGYWKAMQELTEASIDLLEKQVRMYDLVCERLYNLRDKIHIIKYEDLVEDPNIVGAIVHHDLSYFAQKITKREVSFYKNVDTIAPAIKRYGQFYRHFYPDVG